MAWKQLLVILALLGYQVGALIHFGFGVSTDADLAVYLLLAYYAVSLLRASGTVESGWLSLVWKALFAANLAFFVVGLLLFFTPQPGSCMRMGPEVLLFLPTIYWPIFALRKLQGATTPERIVDASRPTVDAPLYPCSTPR